MRKERRKEQRKINKIVRALNENLLHDNLWRGRFYIHQIASNWERFDDGSGGVLIVLLEIRDKKTGLYKKFKADNYDWGYHYWVAVNDFIVLDSDVWKDIDAVKADTTDWSKKTFIPTKEIL